MADRCPHPSPTREYIVSVLMRVIVYTTVVVLALVVGTTLWITGRFILWMS